jgi:PAS domain-containing protein
VSRIHIQFLDQEFHRVLFDAVPVPIFVVDADVSVLDYNAAAGRLAGKNRRLVIRRRGGEVLHCVHSTEVPEGCGRAPACRTCVVRKSVQTASRGRRVSRRWARMELITKGRKKRSRVDVRVSCEPFTYEGRSFILLILEGLNG